MKTYLKLIALTLGLIITVSCDKNDKDTPEEYRPAEKQLRIDYPAYDLSDVKWTTERNYQVARFSILTKAAASTTPVMTAWYSVDGDNADRKMDTKNFGTAIPEIIKDAFEKDTVYSNDKLWRIDEIELENRYDDDDKVSEKVYEMELESVTNPKLEAELFFSATTGKLLFSKESLDDDDSDDSDDKYVVTPELTAAVLLKFPNAHILDAEVDDNQIEVEAIDTTTSPKTELELLFTMSYEFIKSEVESKNTYEKVSTDFSNIKAWFEDTTNGCPIPPANTEVEITKGEFIEEDSNKAYKYEVEIEYEKDGTEYEVEFYLAEDGTIIKAEKDD